MDRNKEFAGTMPVKDSHKFDEAKLKSYLEDNIGGLGGDFNVAQFKGGQSNPTYKIIFGDRSFVMRRKPPGKILSTAHAVDREYRVITALQDTPVPVAKTYCYCDDPEVIGTPFYIMDFMDGTVYWDTALPEKTAEQRPAFFTAMNTALSALHNVDHQAVGLGDYGKPGNYVARQVHRWSKQYKASPLDSIPAMDRLVEWLPENIPETDEVAIVHGDYRIDNIMFHREEPEIIALLDWELSTLGDPLADFSYHCMLWRLPPDLFNGIHGLDLKALGIPTEEEYVQAYCKATNRDGIDSWDFYLAYNMFRLAAILEGISARVQSGTASNEHAKSTGAMAEPLAEYAWKQVEKSMAAVKEV